MEVKVNAKGKVKMTVQLKVIVWMHVLVEVRPQVHLVHVLVQVYMYALA